MVFLSLRPVMPVEAVPVTRVLQLKPDPTRVIARPFTAGEEVVGATGARTRQVIARVLALTEEQVDQTLDDVVTRFATRHRTLLNKLDDQASETLAAITDLPPISTSRRLLIGAYFTHEYAVEAAALANPSMVPHPIQDVDGAIRFVMSVRGIGEGHRSSIGFRPGSVWADGRIWVDPTGPYAEMGRGTPGTQHRSLFMSRLSEGGHDEAQIGALLGQLPATFTRGRFADFSLFPTALRDLALVVEESVPAADVQEVVAKAARAAAGSTFAVERTAVFDVYRGAGLPPGKKSLAFSLAFRSAGRTLTDDEVNAAFQRLQDDIVRTTGWQIRK